MTFLIGKRHSSQVKLWRGKQAFLELFHAKELEDPSSVAVLVTVSSFEAMDEFMKSAGDAIADSGHILESTQVTLYEN